MALPFPLPHHEAAIEIARLVTNPSIRKQFLLRCGLSELTYDDSKPVVLTPVVLAPAVLPIIHASSSSSSNVTNVTNVTHPLRMEPWSGGDLLWVVRQHLIEQCDKRALHLPSHVHHVVESGFLQMYRQEVRNESSSNHFWEAMHMYATFDPHNDTMTNPISPAQFVPTPAVESPVVDVESRETTTVDELRPTATPIPSRPVSPGLLIVCFKQQKHTKTAIRLLSKYMKFYGMKNVDMYFDKEQAKGVQHAIQSDLVDIHVRQFEYSSRLHSAVVEHVLSPLRAVAMTDQEKQQHITVHEISEVAHPATRPTDSICNRMDAHDAYMGFRTGQIIDYTSRSTSEPFYRCVGLHK